MKQETIQLPLLTGDHHFTILNESDMKELAMCGIACTSFNPDGSFSYIITEECWNKYYKGENDMINNDNERVFLEAMLYAMEDKSPSLAIEDQEKREQQKVVRNCRLPKKAKGSIPNECREKGLPAWGTLERSQMDWGEYNRIITGNKIEWAKQQYGKMGIKILGESDDLFYSVELPEGWKIEATDHSMWNKVVDDKGRERISFFYKGAFYDRDAFSNFQRRYNFGIYPFDFYETDASYEERESKPWSAYLTDGGKRVKLLKESKYDENNESWEVDDMLRKCAKAYLNEHYPDWEDINAYWD